MSTPVTRMTTVYGDTRYVSTTDWDGMGVRSHLLPIYTRDGRKWSETKAGQDAAKRGASMSIHRDNLCPPNIAALARVARNAEALLQFIDATRGTGPQEELLANGAHCLALRQAIEALHAA